MSGYVEFAIRSPSGTRFDHATIGELGRRVGAALEVVDVRPNIIQVRLYLGGEDLDNIRLRQENAHLQQALATRVIVEQAKGLIVGAAHVEMDVAFELLRTFARNHNRNIHEVCGAVVRAATGGAKDMATAKASVVRLASTPLYADIMETWRDRPRSPKRHRKVPGWM